MMDGASENPEFERQQMSVDIACVGFGPAMGGFLTALSRELQNPIESSAAPGMPLQVVCYERADDIAFGVSGVVTRARGIRDSFPELDASQIPMAVPVSSEKLVYLLDPHGASRRSLLLRAGDRVLRTFGRLKHQAFEIPYIPSFLAKHDGLVLSIGQFNQWVGAQLMGSGAVQIWPAMPVAEPLMDGVSVVGIRLADQGVDRAGRAEAAFMPGIDVQARLTVVADGPVGAVGRALSDRVGIPEGHDAREWAVGMKMVVELPDGCSLEPGTVLHTFGYPEPEIFGFFYVHPGGLASVGIFVPSWLPNPSRTGYRYLQHYLQHPYIWRHVKGGKLRSWGAKSLQESGRSSEPFLCGNGYARIGEGSGSTNVLTGSGVDEAWTTGTQLAEAVVELLRSNQPFTKENLDRTYVQRRRASWVDRESKIAQHARNGFQGGLAKGLLGMALAGFTDGIITLGARSRHPHQQFSSVEQYYSGRLSHDQIAAQRSLAERDNTPLHDALMNACGWPEIEYDGQLLVSHQDVLLMGGKVQATPGYADHVVFIDPILCQSCEAKTCIEMCSGQAIARGDGAAPAFDREKCIHCGACLWNCSRSVDGVQSNIEFRAGAGGLHSAEN